MINYNNFNYILLPISKDEFEKIPEGKKLKILLEEDYEMMFNYLKLNGCQLPSWIVSIYQIESDEPINVYWNKGTAIEIKYALKHFPDAVINNYF